ncbi:MAG: hypothetical protein AAFN05_12405, partial [Pseudomonadota bacterium]
VQDFVGYVATLMPVRVDCPETLSFAEVARAVDQQAKESFAHLNLAFMAGDAFKQLGEHPATHLRALSGALAPEHRAKNSVLEPLISSGDGAAIRIAGVEVRPMPMNTRNIGRPSLGMRSLFSRSSAVIQYSFEHVSWTRDDAMEVLGEALARLGVEAPAETLISRSARFGAAADWAALEAGRLPSTVGNEFTAAPALSPADAGAR